MAGLDEQLDVSVHEGHGHGHSGTVWKNKFGVLTETLDDAEDVIPATAVETRRVVAELVDNLRTGKRIVRDGSVAQLTSSISKAAGMVSMSTVPLMVPLLMPM